jgi:3-hydroxy-5-methyl-1-naphthoate 3-O-methyltransferase
MSETDFTTGFKTERMTDIALAYKKSCTLATALDLELFSAIAGGARSLAQIALAISLDEEKTDRLLTVCKAIDLIREVDGGYQNLSDVERYLVKDSRTYFGDYLTYMTRRDYDAWPELTANLTTVAPEPESVEGDKRTYLSVMDDPKYAREFTVAGYEASLGLGYKLTKEFDFSSHRRWLDIAGGSGCYSIPACERNPELTSTVLDLPNVLTVTREYVAEHGLAERIDTAEGNFLEPGMPTDYDLVSFITPLQGYMPDKVIAALRNAWDSLESGGTILIIDYMLNEAKSGPIDPAFVNLFGVRKGHYINRVNTGSEWCSFLVEAGYENPEVRWFTPHQLGLVTARKP